MTENNALSVVPRQLTPWPKGVSGNPGGRPKGLAKAIREKTKDGDTLIEFMIQVFEGREIEGKKPALKDRMDAATWLADRGFGKPVQATEISGPDGGPIEVDNASDAAAEFRSRIVRLASRRGPESATERTA